MGEVQFFVRWVGPFLLVGAGLGALWGFCTLAQMADEALDDGRE